MVRQMRMLAAVLASGFLALSFTWPAVAVGVTGGFAQVQADGTPTEWDFVGEYQLDLLTADTALVNKNGGLTVEGLLWCPTIDGLPISDFVGISWDATQYLGRKSAITASYGPAIAHQCNTETPVRWRTLGPGTQNKVQWIYAANGKFGVGTVHLELRVLSYQEIILELGEEGCPATGIGTPFWDANGDGVCAYAVYLWGAEQVDLRVIRSR
jgi:hypothetical protein